jgi:hypothetical protein
VLPEEQSEKMPLIFALSSLFEGKYLFFKNRLVEFSGVSRISSLGIWVVFLDLNVSIQHRIELGCNNSWGA